MILRLALILYGILWAVLLPFVLLYLWKRGRRDPGYTMHIAERFGVYEKPLPQNALWFHAVSLGETRSAVGLIRLALARGDKVVITNFTPAGRREAERQFPTEIAIGQLAVVYAPFDMHWCYRRFFRTVRPRIGLTLEVEIWPAMIMASKAAGIPLFMCNAQYGQGPFARDSHGLRLRQRLIPHFAGAFAKSEPHADRFKTVGLENVTITGELRFDQPVPPAHVDAAKRLRPRLAGDREVISIASGVEGEEKLYLNVIEELGRRAKARNATPPLIVYVPRAPERFEAVGRGLEDAGLSVLRRSDALGADLTPVALSASADVFLGDSLGEMYFYLALSDRVVVGAGFTPHGAHNIIEPLMLSKPVVTGPYTWTIEFPFVEAEAASLARSVADQGDLIEELSATRPLVADGLSGFLELHSGSSERTLQAIDRVLSGRS